MAVATGSDAKEAYDVAIRLLARREHSQHELREKLRRRNYSDDAVRSVLEDLSHKGYLSDARYVEVYVRARLSKEDGPLKIRSYLQKHGIDQTLISQHLPSADQFWFERALKSDRKCWEKNGITSETAADFDSVSVRARYLKNRGYPAQVISRVLDSPT